MFRLLVMLIVLFSLAGCQLEGDSSGVGSANTATDEKENHAAADGSDDSSTSSGEEKNPADILDSSVLVYVTAGAIQCDYKGRTPVETAQLLVNEGIDVLSSYCGVTDMAHITVCGASTGDINLHEINASNLADANEIGFGPVSELVNMGVGYQATECKR